jgi:hypothetical protein
MQDTTLVRLALPPAAYSAAVEYLEYLYGDQGWFVLPVAFLSMSDRSNYRDCEGNVPGPEPGVFGTGASLSATLLLSVDETPPESPPPPVSPPFTLIALKTFSTNKDIINYLKDIELAGPDREAVDIKHEHKEETKGGVTSVKTKYEVMDQDGNKVIKFETHWQKGPPSHVPPCNPPSLPCPPLGSEGLVTPLQLFIRFASDQMVPQRKLQFSRNDTTYTIPVEKISYLQFNLSDPDLAAIFNGLTVKAANLASFTNRLQAYDEVP